MEKENMWQHIDIPADNEDQRREFFEKYGKVIEDFVKARWTEYRSEIQEDEEKTSMDSLENEEKNDIVENNNIEDNNVPENNNIVEENVVENPSEPSPEENKENMKDEILAAQIKNKYLTFPNGKVNQAYKVAFDVESLLPEVGEVAFLGLEDIGLHYNLETSQIEGTPDKAGDHKITMKLKRKDWTDGKPVFEKEITLIINPDPRSLWNNIPTPTDVEYYKPDSDKEVIIVKAKKNKNFLGLGKKEPRKDMVAASQRGRSHAHEGKARDDDFALHFDEATNWYVLTVADGAGSAKYSRKGSQIACQTVIDVCKAKLETQKAALEKGIQEFQKDESAENRKKVGDIIYDVIGSAVFMAYKNIGKEAQEKGNPVKDYATTLIVSICKKFDFGWFVGAFWVGDGGIGIYTQNPAFLKVLGEPDGGEFAGQTRFLTMTEIIQPAEIYKRLRFGIMPDFTALVLMTDGVTDPKFETDANLNKIEKWHDLWNDLCGEVNFADDNEEVADQLLKWLDFWSQGNHDDRTIAILF